MNPFEWKREQVMLSPKESDEIKTTTVTIDPQAPRQEIA